MAWTYHCKHSHQLRGRPLGAHISTRRQAKRSTDLLNGIANMIIDGSDTGQADLGWEVCTDEDLCANS